VSPKFNCPAVAGEGGRLRDAALASHQSKHDAKLRQAESILLRVLLDRGSATIDDLRGLVEIEPNARWLGALPKRLVGLEIVVHDGYVSSSRETSHARPVARWRMVGRAAAEARLLSLNGLAQLKPSPPSVDLARSANQSLLF
jgi:hypothetical protein